MSNLGGRPRKYHTEEERKAGAAARQRKHKALKAWTENIPKHAKRIPTSERTGSRAGAVRKQKPGESTAAYDRYLKYQLAHPEKGATYSEAGGQYPKEGVVLDTEEHEKELVADKSKPTTQELETAIKTTETEMEELKTKQKRFRNKKMKQQTAVKIRGLKKDIMKYKAEIKKQEQVQESELGEYSSYYKEAKRK